MLTHIYTEKMNVHKCTQCCFTDIDECGVSDHCSQQCINTVGSYNCSCKSGYRLNDNQKTCDGKLALYKTCWLCHLNCFISDIDECNTTAFAIQPNSCEELCINVPGSYYCTCSAGYQLSDDKRSCVGMTDTCSNILLLKTNI